MFFKDFIDKCVVADFLDRSVGPASLIPLLTYLFICLIALVVFWRR